MASVQVPFVADDSGARAAAKAARASLRGGLPKALTAAATRPRWPRRPVRESPLLRLACALCLIVAPPAVAQGWETFSHDLGAGAAVCPYDDPETGDFFCFALACLRDRGPPMVRVATSGEGFAAMDTPPLQVIVDGKTVGRFFLPLLSSDGMRDYGVAVDPDRDAALIEALRVGRRATLIFGIGLGAIVQDISLAGSQAAIDAVPLLCGSVPLSAPEED